MSKWWETFEWGQVEGSTRLHAVPGVSSWTACGLRSRGRHWDSAADLPRCKSCERSIAATVKRWLHRRYEGGQPK